MSVYSAAVSASESFFHVAGSVAQATATAAQAAAPVVQAAAPAAQAAGPIMAALGAAWSMFPIGTATIGAVNLANNMYQGHVKSQDNDFLEALRKEDCGGLSKMTLDVEACYRKYVRDAVYRIESTSPVHLDYRKRFDTCFYNRPEDKCSWGGWWNMNQIYEAGKGLKIDKQYITGRA